MKNIISLSKNKSNTTKAFMKAIRMALDILIASYYAPNPNYSSKLKDLSIADRFLKVDLLINNFKC